MSYKMSKKLWRSFQFYVHILSGNYKALYVRKWQEVKADSVLTNSKRILYEEGWAVNQLNSQFALLVFCFTLLFLKMEFQKGFESTWLAVCTFTHLIHVTLLLQNIWPFSLYPVFILYSVFIENIGPSLCFFHVPFVLFQAYGGESCWCLLQ